MIKVIVTSLNCNEIISFTNFTRNYQNLFKIFTINIQINKILNYLIIIEPIFLKPTRIKGEAKYFREFNNKLIKILHDDLKLIKIVCF